MKNLFQKKIYDFGGLYGIPYAAVKLSLSLQKQIGVFLNCLFYFFAVHSIGHGDPKSFWGDNFPFSETLSVNAATSLAWAGTDKI